MRFYRSQRELDSLTKSVYAYVAYWIGEGPDAEDIANTTFERAFRYERNYDARRGPAVAWLIGIARRCVDDFYGNAARATYELVDTAASFDLEGAATSRLDLAAALRLLDPRDRELIALRYGADLKVKQIAELLEERTNTVQVALHRALKRLRVLLGDEAAEESLESVSRSLEAL